MFQALIDKFKSVKQDILKQEIKGRYVSSSSSKHIPILLLLSSASLTIGLVLSHVYYNLFETKISYSDTSSYKVYLPKGTIYFYIQLDDFYQNNLKYSKSISYSQLKGKKETNRRHTEPLDSKLINGKEYDYYPAGIIANTYLQDKYTLKGLEISTEDIAWNGVNKKIKRTEYRRNEVLSPPLWKKYDKIPNLKRDKRFTNWIYTSPFYNFRKLWGIIEVKEAGEYEFDIESYYPYGRKSVVFSEVSWGGNKNYFLSVGMIIVGMVGLLFTLMVYRKMI